MDYENGDATWLAAQVARGEVTPDELLDAALARVHAVNPALNAVVLVQEDVARASIRNGLPDGPFRGVPFLLKDLGAEAVDFPTHSGSRLFMNTRHPGNSAIFDRMKATGIVSFGRTTAPEGGMGPATEAAVYGGPTHNPWDLDRVPGGSSGGAGAAVAAGIVPIAHGSDGGGSVRIPASNCGLFGFKATRARFPDGPFSGEGWAGMAIDGFLSRSVRDSAAMMDACAGPDQGAPYFPPPLGKGYLAAIETPPARLRIGLCDTDFLGNAVHPACKEAAQDAGRLLASLGHEVFPLRPKADHAGMIRAWVEIVACGAALSVQSAVEARGRALEPDEIEAVTRGACTFAATISGADYLAAVGKIHAYGREMAAVFNECDIVLSPVMAEPPALIGRFAHTTEDYLDYRLGPEGVFRYSPFCTAFNASGQPAASVPTYWYDGLPIGVQVAAAFGEDEQLIALCHEIEQARPWFHRRPPHRMETLAKSGPYGPA